MKEALGVFFLALGVVAGAVAAVSAIGFAASFFWIMVDPAGDWSRTGEFGRVHFMLSLVLTLGLAFTAFAMIFVARRLLARS